MRPGRWLVVTIVAVACLLSVFVVTVREADLQRRPVAELALDYESSARLCAQVGYDRDEFIAEARANGVTSLIVRGTSINQLVADGRLVLLSGRELADAVRLGEQVVEIAPRTDMSYLLIADDDLVRQVERGLDMLLGHIGVHSYAVDGGSVVAVAAGVDELYELQLPIAGAADKLAAKYGLAPVYLLGPVPRRAPEAVLVLFDEVCSGNRGRILVRGWTVPGFPQYGRELGMRLAARGFSAGVYENRAQTGIGAVVEAADYAAFRARVIQPGDRDGSIALAARDRSISMFCIEPALGTRSVDRAVDMWLSLIARARDELHSAGVDIRAVDAGVVYRVPLWALFAIGCGVGAGLWLAVAEMMIWPKKAVVGTALAVVVGGISLSGASGRELVSFIAAVVFPVLGVLLVMKRPGSGLRGLAVAVFIVLGVAAAGGLMVNALLGDTAWVLQIRQFRGVKAAHIVPLAMIAIAAWQWYQKKAGDRSAIMMSRAAGSGVSILALTAFVCALAAAYVYVGRTGHTLGLPVPDIEVLLRGMLERLLGIRPRTKELLVGYPALVLAVWAMRRGMWWSWALALAATVAPVSVVNSFSHLHTPVVNSAIRSVMGAGLGLIFGGIALLLVVYVAGKWGGAGDGEIDS